MTSLTPPVNGATICSCDAIVDKDTVKLFILCKKSPERKYLISLFVSSEGDTKLNWPGMSLLVCPTLFYVNNMLYANNKEADQPVGSCYMQFFNILASLCIRAD